MRSQLLHVLRNFSDGIYKYTIVFCKYSPDNRLIFNARKLLQDAFMHFHHGTCVNVFFYKNIQVLNSTYILYLFHFILFTCEYFLWFYWSNNLTWINFRKFNGKKIKAKERQVHRVIPMVRLILIRAHVFWK